MSNDQTARRPPAKSSGGGAPMGSTISIIVAVVAVIVGFLILRNINDDSGPAVSGGPDTASTVPTGDSSNPDASSSTSSSTPAPSTTVFVTTGATVVVANASGVPGAALAMTTSLQGVGFTTGDPTNAVGTEQRIDVSKVYYIDDGTGAARAVADTVALAMNGIIVATMPSPVPVEGEAAGLGEATVLLMLGKDYGGKPLPILEPAGSATTLATSPLSTSTTLAG